MFNQFRVLYPKGSLVTELVTIKHGKYLVRALVQVEGATIATGMAAAETVELAEDHARNRVLIFLGIQSTTAIAPGIVDTTTQVPVAEKTLTLASTPNTFKTDTEVREHSDIHHELIEQEITSSTTPVSFPEIQHSAIPVATTQFVEPSEPDIVETSPADEAFELPVATITSIPNSSKVLDVVEPVPETSPVSTSKSKRKSSSSESQTNNLTMPAKESATTSSFAPPPDMSDIIAKTTVEIKRLGWSNQKGRDYLMTTYNKRGRSELTDQELQDFLYYLESQPSPED